MNQNNAIKTDLNLEKNEIFHRFRLFKNIYFYEQSKIYFYKNESKKRNFPI